MENEKKEDHVDDQDDVINNSHDVAEEHAQNALIGNHDNSSEGDKPTKL